MDFGTYSVLDALTMYMVVTYVVVATKTT